jgi:hypothetical protein
VESQCDDFDDARLRTAWMAAGDGGAAERGWGTTAVHEGDGVRRRDACGCAEGKESGGERGRCGGVWAAIRRQDVCGRVGEGFTSEGGRVRGKIGMPACERKAWAVGGRTRG